MKSKRSNASSLLRVVWKRGNRQSEQVLIILVSQKKVKSQELTDGLRKGFDEKYSVQ